MNIILLIIFVAVIFLANFIRKERNRGKELRKWKKKVNRRYKRFVKYLKAQQKLAKKAGDDKLRDSLIRFRKVKHDRK